MCFIQPVQIYFTPTLMETLLGPSTDLKYALTKGSTWVQDPEKRTASTSFQPLRQTKTSYQLGNKQAKKVVLSTTRATPSLETHKLLMIGVWTLMWVSRRGNVSLWCLIMSALRPGDERSREYMCSSYNTVQLGVEAEWRTNDVYSSTQDALEIHSRAHEEAWMHCTLQRQVGALLAGSPDTGWWIALFSWGSLRLLTDSLWRGFTCYWVLEARGKQEFSGVSASLSSTLTNPCKSDRTASAVITYRRLWPSVGPVQYRLQVLAFKGNSARL